MTNRVPTPDKIQLEGMCFYAFHGATPQEKIRGNRFTVDLEVEGDFQEAGLSDDIQNTVNYSQLYRTVQEVMAGPPRNLLESLAETIASRILGSFPVKGVRVRVRKLGVFKGATLPLPGADPGLPAAAVEIYRQRESG